MCYDETMKIIIAGYGMEGRSNYAYFRRAYPQAEVIITDQQPVENAPEGVTVLTGPAVFGQLPEADLVVRTAGLPPRDIQTTGKTWSATNEFFARCPAPIIGVTGTKGKGTTCSLIASVLRAAGRTVHLIGNIGVPALDELAHIQPDDVVVYELSSFQLWDLERSPHVAVVLMIEPDHLDKHADFAEYVAAKANIRRHQQATDRCLYHPTNQFARAVAATPRRPVQRSSWAEGQPVKVGRQDEALAGARRYAVSSDCQVHVESGFFCVQGRRLCSVEQLQLPGEHNQENACAALSAALAIEPALDASQAAAGLAAFTGLPHRLKQVANQYGVTYYDDSIATTPGSTIAALRAFEAPKVLIIGGQDKGGDYRGLAQEIARHQVRTVLLIGRQPRAIAAALQQYAPAVPVVPQPQKTMAQTVKEAARLARAGDVVILSPAAASFDQYRNYVERGQQFVAAVRDL